MTQSEAEIPQDPGRALSGGQIARAATIIMLALVVSGVLGLIRQSVIAAAFGAGRELDAFYAALRVPETLFVLVAGGALGSAFIPVFERFLADDDFDGAWRLASAALTIVAAAATLLSVVAFVLADVIVENLLVPGADAPSQALTAELMRMMLATVVIFGISGLVMGILNGYQHFFAPAFAPSMYNLGLIGGAVLLAPSMGVKGLAWGAVIGAGLHLAIQIPVLLRLDFARLRLNFDFRSDGVGEVLLLMGPRVLGLGVVQVNFWVNAALTSDMAAGSLTALTTAFTLMFTVLGILGQSIGTAVFPTLARLHAEKDEAAFDRTLTGALSGVLFLSIPAGIGMAVLATPIVTILFERDEWTHTDTAGTAWALALFGIGLAGHAALEVLARAFYALHDTWTPVKVGGATMVLNIILSLLLIRALGYPGETDFARGPFGGLALAMSIATAIESTTLWIILRRRVELNDGPVLMAAFRTLLAALVMAAIVGAWMLLSDDLPALPRLVVGMAIGIAGFWGVALVLRVDEAHTVPRTVVGRLSRR